MCDLSILPCCEHMTRKKWKHLPHEKALSGVTIIIVDVVNRIDTAVVYACSLCSSSACVTWFCAGGAMQRMNDNIVIRVSHYFWGKPLFIRVWH